MLPQFNGEPRAPRRFREMAAAAQGRLGGVTGILDFNKDILKGAAPPDKEPRPLSEIAEGADRVEDLGERYVALKNFGMSDTLFYLRMQQSFGMIRATLFNETPRRLSDIGVNRTLLGQIIVENADTPEEAIMFAYYMGIVFDTPARHTLMIGCQEESILGIALNEKFRSASAYNTVLAGQVLLRAKLEGVTATGGGRPWYEPFSDLSGIIAMLGTLQTAKIRPDPKRILGIRSLSKIKRNVLKLIDPYGDYMLPRGTLVLEIDGLIHERDSDPLTGLSYEKYGVGAARERGIVWFRGKVPGRAYNALSKIIPAVKEKKDEIAEELKSLYNFTFGFKRA